MKKRLHIVDGHNMHNLPDRSDLMSLADLTTRITLAALEADKVKGRRMADDALEAWFVYKGELKIAENLRKLRA